VVVLPPFYRTWWFLSLAALSVAGAVFAAFKYRVAQLERRQAAQQDFSRQLIESQEAERKRIACWAGGMRSIPRRVRGRP
jgi:signal transduction histidine kinase